MTRCDWASCLHMVFSVQDNQIRCSRSSVSIVQVVKLPLGAEVLATSGTAPNEIWTFRDKALAIQGHPEMPASEALNKIYPFLEQNGSASRCFACCDFTVELASSVTLA